VFSHQRSLHALPKFGFYKRVKLKIFLNLKENKKHLEIKIINIKFEITIKRKRTI
jgi:hypothetical protein